MSEKGQPLCDAVTLAHLSQYNRIHVGYSGGLDSTVLLHFLASQRQFAPKLHAIHVHHGLSPNACRWQQHCESFCKSLGIPLYSQQVNISGQSNLEAKAREARRHVFIAQVKAGSCLVLGHHADDQAETLLLNLFRGAGVDGLSGIKRISSLGDAVIFRPLLDIPRSVLSDYANAHQLSWVEDESNADTRFFRNFIRHQVLPLVKKQWPMVDKNLARTASHCLDTKILLQQLAELDCIQSKSETLDIKPLVHLPRNRLINVLRHWLAANRVRMPESNLMQQLVDEVCLARQDANPKISFDNICIRRHRGVLYLLPLDTPSCLDDINWLDFPKPLTLPNSSRQLQAISATKGLKIKASDSLTVRFNQQGLSLRWRGQSKSLKKLWQQWAIPVWQRPLVPLLYINGRLAAVVGYAVSDEFYSEEEAWVVEVTPQ